MVQTYQLSGMGKFGTSLKVAPMTTEEELNAVKCFQVDGTQDTKIKPQSVLPDLSGFQVSQFICFINWKTYHLYVKQAVTVKMSLHFTKLKQNEQNQSISPLVICTETIQKEKYTLAISYFIIPRVLKTIKV